jgi:hypothetical protein
MYLMFIYLYLLALAVAGISPISTDWAGYLAVIAVVLPVAWKMISYYEEIL